VVVHQAVNWNDSLGENLSPLTVVWCNKSGYVDEPSFRRMMFAFQVQCGPLRPQFVYLDGYDAHFSTVLSKMKEDHIYTFFLRSNNSINDQPNDCGQNAMFESDARLIQMGTRPAIAIKPADVNKCLMQAWGGLKRHAGDTIVKSFEVTGICPLNRNARNHCMNAKLSTLWRGLNDKPLADGQLALMRRPTVVHKEPHVVLRFARKP